MKIAASNVEMSSAHRLKTITAESYQKGTFVGGLFNEEVLKNMNGKNLKKDQDEDREESSAAEEKGGADNA